MTKETAFGLIEEKELMSIDARNNRNGKKNGYRLPTETIAGMANLHGACKS